MWTRELPVVELRFPRPDAAAPRFAGDAEAAAAYALTLDAVNFGSGYFPQLRKRPGLSGYRTLEACLRQRFAAKGPFPSAELAAMNAERCAEIFEQSLEPPAIAELMHLYARAWRELGELLGERYGGEYLALARDADGSAESLVRILLGMALFRDVALYAGEPVPFLKRAQLCAFDLELHLPSGPGHFHDLDRLTLFADNLVPHVLRLDGLLRYDSQLLARIGRDELIPSGSPEEVEIRACALHAVELAVAALRARGEPISAAELDLWLWRRGGSARYKEQPRHRTRCAYY